MPWWRFLWYGIQGHLLYVSNQVLCLILSNIIDKGHLKCFKPTSCCLFFLLMVHIQKRQKKWQDLIELLADLCDQIMSQAAHHPMHGFPLGPTSHQLHSQLWFSHIYGAEEACGWGRHFVVSLVEGIRSASSLFGLFSTRNDLI